MKIEEGLKQFDIWTGLLIFLLFSLTSLGYLIWFYHMLELVSPEAADMISMGAGYGCQALGLGLTATLQYRSKAPATRKVFVSSLALFVVCLVPAAISGSDVGTVIFGLVMNVACGILAGAYLQSLVCTTGGELMAAVFGAGYAASVLVTWAISRLGEGGFLNSGYSILVCLVFAAAACAVMKRTVREHEAGHKKIGVDMKQVILAGLTVFFFSAVVGMGFGFPSSDLMEGVSLETSRIFYAAGLIIAGLICERNRQALAVCTLAALITPFVMLALSGEPLPRTIFWMLDYFVFGFFAVFRVILFADLAKESRAFWLCGMGLLAGRAGDAAGDILSIALQGKVTILVLITALLFAVSIVVFYFLSRGFFSGDDVSSEKMRFQQFSARHDLSQREREVLQLLLEEKTNPQIAEALFVSESTVKYHVHNLLKKTGCKTRLELLSLFYSSKRST